MASGPIVLIWTSTLPSRCGSASRTTASTAPASESMVTTASAPRTASAISRTASTPSIASAFSGVRFQARTSCPAAARLRAIGAPMMPVPRTATRMGLSYPLTRKLPRINGCTRQKYV